MKIQFDDKSYIEAHKSENPGRIIITIAAKDSENPLKKITNSVELTQEQFKNLFLDITPQD